MSRMISNYEVKRRLRRSSVDGRVIGSVRQRVRVVDCIHVNQGCGWNELLPRWERSLGVHKLSQFVDFLRNS
jgi:hypothetical protein